MRVARIGDLRNIYEISMGDIKSKDYLEKLEIDESLIYP
jgi:hypothetical protein